MIPVDTGFWRKKWDDTLGYLVFKESFSSLDILNARFRYNRKYDDNFPIAFDKTTYSIIENRLKDRYDRKLFWAAVIAPTSAFFEWDWMNYKPRGQEFLKVNLVSAITSPEKLLKLPIEKREKAYRSIVEQMNHMGLGDDHPAPKSHFKMPPLRTRAEVPARIEYPTTKEFVDMLDELI